ncbi:MAG: hypothetical protein WBA93_30635 [Microcoleaceae cyanobacterium]
MDEEVLPTKVSKQIIKYLIVTWHGYFQAIGEWSFQLTVSLLQRNCVISYQRSVPPP